MKNIIHIPVKFLLFFTVILMISSLFWLKDIVFLDENDSYEQIYFEKGNWDEITQKARDLKRNLFVFVMDSANDDSQKMLKNVFTEINVSRFYNENYINVLIPANSKKGKELVHQYRILQFPHCIYMHYNGKTKHQLFGYQNPATLLKIGEKYK